MITVYAKGFLNTIKAIQPHKNRKKGFNVTKQVFNKTPQPQSDSVGFSVTFDLQSKDDSVHIVPRDSLVNDKCVTFIESRVCTPPFWVTWWQVFNTLDAVVGCDAAFPQCLVKSIPVCDGQMHKWKDWGQIVFSRQISVREEQFEFVQRVGLRRISLKRSLSSNLIAMVAPKSKNVVFGVFFVFMHFRLLFCFSFSDWANGEW